MIYLQEDLPDLNTLQSIEVLSCFDSYDGSTFTGQVIADAFQVQVDTYPCRITDAVMARHPQWSTTFNPRQPVLEPGMTLFDDLRHITRKHRINLKKERLQTSISSVISIFFMPLLNSNI